MTPDLSAAIARLRSAETCHYDQTTVICSADDVEAVCTAAESAEAEVAKLREYQKVVFELLEHYGIREQMKSTGCADSFVEGWGGAFEFIKFHFEENAKLKADVKSLQGRVVAQRDQLARAMRVVEADKALEQVKAIWNARCTAEAFDFEAASQNTLAWVEKLKAANQERREALAAMKETPINPKENRNDEKGEPK
jgi:hypothetical protein